MYIVVHHFIQWVIFSSLRTMKANGAKYTIYEVPDAIELVNSKPCQRPSSMRAHRQHGGCSNVDENPKALTTTQRQRQQPNDIDVNPTVLYPSPSDIVTQHLL